MMFWLLRIFPSLRHLCSEVESLRAANLSLQQENVRLQDRLDSAREDRKQLFDMVRESISNERSGYQTQINFHAQRHGDPPIYPDAQTLPPASVPTPEQRQPVARRLLPREMTANLTAKFIQNFLSPQVNG